MGRSIFVVVPCFSWLLSGNLFAQGCASCYTTAAAGGPQTAHALRSGILFLLFPPILIFAGIIFVVGKWKSRPPTAPHVSDRHHELGYFEMNEERTR